MLSYLAFFLLTVVSLFSFELGVTYDFSGGRFGDCLLSYLHAKWIAYQKNIPLYYRPFAYSSYLVLHEKEPSLDALKHQPYLRVPLQQGDHSALQTPILYVCPYFPECKWEWKREPYYTFFVDWKDPEFKKIAQSLIQPKFPLRLTLPPQDRVNVALHYREGGGYDGQGAVDGWPMKFPPFSFYVESLKAALSLFPEKPIYCHIFTDCLFPREWVEQLEMAMPKEADIQFGFRRAGNHHRLNVLEDFFSFFEFDLLIRPQSNFSIIPSLIHDFAVVYSPEEFVKEGAFVTITKVRVETNEDLLENLMRKIK